MFIGELVVEEEGGDARGTGDDEPDDDGDDVAGDAADKGDDNGDDDDELNPVLLCDN
jgi:hypothetical protein